MKTLSLWISLFLATAFTLMGCDSQTTTFSNPVAISNTSVGPQVQLAWSASSGSPQGYYVEQSTNNVNFTQIQAVSTNSALVTGLSAGQTYYFRVRAYNKAGDSAYTSITSAVVPAASPTPTN
jgi:hypothetical protein